MKTIITIGALLLASVGLAAEKTVCEIKLVRPLTEQELKEKGIPQVNYGTEYKKELVCRKVQVEDKKEEK
jgi:hypothetical protein